MNFEKCKICKKAFRSYSGRICPECVEQIERDYITIRDYIYDNPSHLGAEELAEKTGVSQAIVIHLINDGRLYAQNTQEGFGGRSQCRVCGKSIPSGSVCSACTAAMTAGIGDVIGSKADNAMKRSKTARMHIRQKD